MTSSKSYLQPQPLAMRATEIQSKSYLGRDWLRRPPLNEMARESNSWCAGAVSFCCHVQKQCWPSLPLKPRRAPWSGAPRGHSFWRLLLLITGEEPAKPIPSHSNGTARSVCSLKGNVNLRFLCRIGKGCGWAQASAASGWISAVCVDFLRPPHVCNLLYQWWTEHFKHQYTQAEDQQARC